MIFDQGFVAKAFFEARSFDLFVPTVLDNDLTPTDDLRFEGFHFGFRGKPGDFVFVNESATVGDFDLKGDVIKMTKVAVFRNIFEQRSGKKGGSDD